MDAMTKGLGPLGGMGSAAAAPEPVSAKGDVQIGRVPDFVRSDWNKDGSKPVHYDRAWYAKPDVAAGQRPPTDEDNWDIPPTEIFKLAAKFPEAVRVVKT